MSRNRIQPQGKQINSLALLLKQSGLSQTELSRASGISRSMISRLVNCDRGMTRDSIDRLKAVFNCSADDLLRDPRRPALRAGWGSTVITVTYHDLVK